MRILVSGRPGVGKTTLIKRLSERIGGCGFYTEEVRDGRRRIGFDGVRIGTGQRIPLARRGEGKYRVGRYAVFVENIGVLIGWLENCDDIVFLDEIGPMELLHPNFADAVVRASQRARIFIGTVHRRLAREWSEKLGAKLYWLTEENRESVYKELLSLLTSLGL